MTADVAQAVEGLRAALALVDELDGEIASSRQRSTTERVQSQRETARADLRKRRAELDAILLGPEA